MVKHRVCTAFILLAAVCVAMFCAVLLTGAAEIPASDVFTIVAGGVSAPDISRIIVLEARLPMAVSALLAGSALSVAGLLMQTTFQNPLAGPSVLGVSSGASLGVAVLTLFAAGLPSIFQSVSIVFGATLGAAAVILLLMALSTALRSATTLLIAGMMLSYLASSVITLLNFFAPATDVKQFAVWGMGSFSGVELTELPLFSILTIIPLLASFLLVKPLNALLLGERYAASTGFSIGRVRNGLLVVSGLLTAVVTAWCGPVGFIGLIVPHIARMLLRTSDHTLLLPATILCGAATALLCAWLSVMPTRLGVLPINAITPVIGVPFILYLLLRRKTTF